MVLSSLGAEWLLALDMPAAGWVGTVFTWPGRPVLECLKSSSRDEFYQALCTGILV